MDNLPKNELIENYLDRILAWLFSRMPAEREQIRLEIQTHIGLIVDQEQGRGATKEHAIGIALKRMGSPDVLGQKLDKAARAEIQQLIRTHTSKFPGKRIMLIAFLFITWGIAAASPLFWLIFHGFYLGFKTLPLWLCDGAITGIGYGIIFAWFKLGLPEMSDKYRAYLREMDADAAPEEFTSPFLPEDASARSKIKHFKNKKINAWLYQSYLEQRALLTNRVVSLNLNAVLLKSAILIFFMVVMAILPSTSVSLSLVMVPILIFARIQVILFVGALTFDFTAAAVTHYFYRKQLEHDLVG